MRAAQEDDGLGRDEYRDRPRKASRREVAGRLNAIATALNFAHEQLSEIRHDLGVTDRLAAQRRHGREPE